MPDRSSAVNQESFRAALCAWLEADGWLVAERPGEHPSANGGAGSRWLAVAYKDGAPLVVAEPAAGAGRLVLSHHLTLEPAERALLEVLTDDERDELAWDLLRHLNLLLVDYEVDRTLPREVRLTLSLGRDGLTREALLQQVARLSAALRIVVLVYRRALGRLHEEHAEPVTH